MREDLPIAPNGAIFPTAQKVSQSPDKPEALSAQSFVLDALPCAHLGGAESLVPDTTCAQLGSESFAAVCEQILGKDAGLHLHLITGLPQRSCYHYASGDRKPPLEFIQLLIHSPQGQPFHEWFMAGCKADWWLDHQRGMRLAAAAERFRREIENLSAE